MLALVSCEQFSQLSHWRCKCHSHGRMWYMARCGYSHARFPEKKLYTKNVYKSEMLEEVDRLFCPN